MRGLVIEEDAPANDPANDPNLYSRLPLGNVPETFADSSWKKVKWNFNLLNSSVKGNASTKFEFCKGNLVVMGGYYGSHLKEEDGILGWLTMDMILGLKKCNIMSDKKWTPNGILDKIGPLDVCSSLLKELCKYADQSDRMEIHQYAYDW